MKPPLTGEPRPPRLCAHHPLVSTEIGDAKLLVPPHVSLRTKPPNPAHPPLPHVGDAAVVPVTRSRPVAVPEDFVAAVVERPESEGVLRVARGEGVAYFGSRPGQEV